MKTGNVPFSWVALRWSVTGSIPTKPISAPRLAGAATATIHIMGVVMIRPSNVMPRRTMDRKRAAATSSVPYEFPKLMVSSSFLQWDSFPAGVLCRDNAT